MKDDSNPDRQGQPDDRVERAVKSPAIRSKLDSFAQDIVAWRSEGRDFRTIAKLLKDRENLDVAFGTVARWYKKRNALVAQRLERAEVRMQVTREIIETEFARQIHEFYVNYINAEDPREKAVWAKLYQDACRAMLQKLVPTPAPVALAKETEDRMSSEEFWRRIKWRE